MLKKCQIVMLPTEKAEDCIIITHNKFAKYGKGYFAQDYLSSWGAKSYHLYFLSDEEINKGDYHIYRGVVRQYPYDTPWSEKGKIIATTDKSIQSLKFEGTRFESFSSILVGVKAKPSQAFLEVFVKEYNKGNIIKEVMVEYEIDEDTSKGYIIGKGQPCIEFIKVNSKDNTITIKPIKDSWNRQEVETLIREWALYTTIGANRNWKPIDLDNWIEQNL